MVSEGEVEKDVEEGEIETDSDTEPGETKSSQQQKNAKQLLSNQERIDRLYSSILNDTEEVSQSWSTETSPKKLEKNNRSFQKAISGVLSPSHHTKKLKHIANQVKDPVIHESDFEADVEDSVNVKNDGIQVTEKEEKRSKKQSKSKEKDAHHKQEASKSPNKQSYRPLSTAKASLAEPFSLSKDKLRMIADTLIEKHSSKKGRRKSSSSSTNSNGPKTHGGKGKTDKRKSEVDGNDSSMDIDSSEEMDAQGGVPILFGASTPQLSDNEEQPTEKSSSGSQENNSISSQTFQPPVLPGPILAPAPMPPQLPGFIPPPPFAVWQQYQHSAMPPPMQPSTSTFQSDSPDKLTNYASFSGQTLGSRGVATSSTLDTSHSYLSQKVKSANESTSTFVPPMPPPLPRHVPLAKPPLPPLPPPPIVLKIGKNTESNAKDSRGQMATSSTVFGVGATIGSNEAFARGDSQRNPVAVFNSPPFKHRPQESQLTSKRATPTEARDIDYRAINSPVKNQQKPSAEQVAKDTDLRQKWSTPAASDGGHFSNQSRLTNWSKPPSDPPFKRRSTITIAPLASRGKTQVAGIGRAQPLNSTTATANRNIQPMQPPPAVIRSSVSYPNMQNAFALEDENLRLWQEAVASMAEKRNSMRTKQIQLSITTPTSSSCSSNSSSAQSSRKSSSSGNDAEKAHSPPLIVPIDDEIKVVEIANSPPTDESLVAISNEDTFPNDNIDDAFDDAESYFEETEISEQVSESGVNENRQNNGLSSDSSSDAEIELLELRREAMKSMVEKDKPSSENAGGTNSSSEEKSVVQPQKAEKFDQTKRTAESKSLQKSASQAKLSTIVVEVERAKSVDSLPERKLTIAEFQDSNDKKEGVKSDDIPSEVKQIDITVDSKNNKIVSFNQSSGKVDSSLAKPSELSKAFQVSEISKTSLKQTSSTQPAITTFQINNTNLTCAVKSLSVKSKSFDQKELKQQEAKSLSRTFDKISLQASNSKVNISGSAFNNAKNPSAFRKVNNSPVTNKTGHEIAPKTGEGLASQLDESPQITARKVLPTGLTQLKRRIKRPSVTLSGRVTKPLSKSLFVKAYQTKLVKTNPHLPLRRSSRFATNKLNVSHSNVSAVSRNGKRLHQKNNPFSKVNAKRVNYDCQAPKHPPLVINFGLDLHEEVSSDEEHGTAGDSMMVASLSDSDVLSQSSSQVEVPSSVLTGKHMTSMLSWTPRNNLVASQDDLTFECKRPQNVKGSLNPFARKKHSGNVCLSTDPFVENIFTRRISDTELKDFESSNDENSLKEKELLTTCVSDSEVSIQLSTVLKSTEDQLALKSDHELVRQNTPDTVTKKSEITDDNNMEIDSAKASKITSDEKINDNNVTENKVNQGPKIAKADDVNISAEKIEIENDSERCESLSKNLTKKVAKEKSHCEKSGSNEKENKEQVKEKSSSHSNIFDMFDNDDEIDSTGDPVNGETQIGSKIINKEVIPGNTTVDAKPRLKIVSPFKFKPVMTEKKVAAVATGAEISKSESDRLPTPERALGSAENKPASNPQATAIESNAVEVNDSCSSNIKEPSILETEESVSPKVDVSSIKSELVGSAITEKPESADCIMPGNLDEMIHNARISATAEKSLSSDVQMVEVAKSPQKIPTTQPALAKETKDLLHSSPKRSEIPKEEINASPPSAASGNSSNFSNAVIKKFKKQLLFVKTSREETELSIMATRKQLRRTQSKLVDAGQLASDLKRQLATVHKSIDSLRQAAGDCDRKLLELEQKEKAMKAFEKQLLQKMTTAELTENSPGNERSESKANNGTSSTQESVTRTRIRRVPMPNKISNNSGLVIVTNEMKKDSINITDNSSAKPEQEKPPTPVRLMARKTIPGSSGKRKRNSSSTSCKLPKTVSSISTNDVQMQASVLLQPPNEKKEDFPPKSNDASSSALTESSSLRQPVQGTKTESKPALNLLELAALPLNQNKTLHISQTLTSNSEQKILDLKVLQPIDKIAAPAKATNNKQTDVENQLQAKAVISAAVAKTKPSIKDAKSSLAAELEATNQKLAVMRSAVIASGQNVPHRWKTNRPKWHSLSRVSRPIITRSYAPPNLQPSKSDLQKNNLVISNESANSSNNNSNNNNCNTSSNNSTSSVDLSNFKIGNKVQISPGRRPLTRSRSSNVLLSNSLSEHNLNYGSKAASPFKHLQSNPAATLAAIRNKFAEMVVTGGFGGCGPNEQYLVPKDNNLPKVSIKDISLRNFADKKLIAVTEKLKPNGKAAVGSFSVKSAIQRGEFGEFDKNVVDNAIYDSPLKMFKSYRFCPDFLFTLRGNEGSSTWSHSIDPFTPLCPFDLHGQCADKLCSFQHTKDYTLTRIQLACDLLAYLHISPESSIFTEQSLQKQELNKREQFEDLQKKLESTAQQITKNELTNLTRSQIVKDMVGSVNRSRISSRKSGEPIPEHHIMPGSRSWRPLNSRKRLHHVTESSAETDQSNYSVSTAGGGNSKKAKSCSDSQSDQESQNELKRSKSEDSIIQKALESASNIVKNSGANNSNESSLKNADSESDGSVGRYFENKFDRKSAKELRSLIQSESGDVTAWIELAKWTENNPQLKTGDEIQKAKLSVLARALEVNKGSVELWNFYVTEFAKSSFNTMKGVMELCTEAMAYVTSDFILFLMFEMESNAKKKADTLWKLIETAVKSAAQRGSSGLVIQRLILYAKIRLVSSPVLEKTQIGKTTEKLMTIMKSDQLYSCADWPMHLSFLWLISIQLTDSGTLPSHLDRHLIEDFAQWSQQQQIFESFEIEWVSKSKTELSSLLEIFGAATESVKNVCGALDVPNLEPLFSIKRNFSRLLHFHKEHKQANSLLVECVRSAFTCYLPESENNSNHGASPDCKSSDQINKLQEANVDKCCEFVSVYALQTLQFAYNANGIKPTLDSHFEKLHALEKKPTLLVKLYAQCAEIALNKKWSGVTKYFVELALKYFYGNIHSSHEQLRRLLCPDLEGENLSTKPLQAIAESQKPYLSTLLSCHLELEKETDAVVNNYESALTSHFAIVSQEALLYLWSSYLSFLIRFVKLNKTTTTASSTSQQNNNSQFSSDQLKNPSQAIAVLFQRAVTQCCSSSINSNISGKTSNILGTAIGGLDCCESTSRRLEKLCRIVLPNLALEPRVNMVEWLLEQFPSNLYLLRMYEVAAKYNLRGAQSKCVSTLSEINRMPCMELIQTAVQMSLQIDDLSQALSHARSGREAFPFAAGFWYQELVILCCATESCQDIPKVVQLALDRGGLELNEFLAPILSST